MFKRKPHHQHTPKPPGLWSNITGLFAWLRLHFVASLVSFFGLVASAGSAWYYGGPWVRAFLHRNDARDAAITSNAQKTDALTTQVYAWHTELVGVGDGQENQIRGIRADLKEATTQMSELTAAVRETNATVRGLTATQDEQNKRLDIITEMMMRQAMSGEPKQRFVAVPDGPPAPGRQQ